MAKLKIKGKISKRHWITLLEERIAQLEQRVDALESIGVVRVIPCMPPYSTDKTGTFPPYRITIS
jgi:hypothetical protein